MSRRGAGLVLWALLLTPPAAAQGLQAQAEALPRPTGPGLTSRLVLPAPCHTPGGRFGESTVALDMDGDGSLELAVGAWGEDAVHVFFEVSQHGLGQPPWSQRRVFSATGPAQCGDTHAPARFGYDVTAAQLDGDAAHELVVGAPHADVDAVGLAGALYVFGGVDGGTPLRLTSAAPQPGNLGQSVAAGDLDGDGWVDLAASAPKDLVGGVSAGRVHVFLGPFDADGAAGELVLDNPYPVPAGNFGQHLAVTDGDGDGRADLFVSAIGNTAGGLAKAGQVFVFPGPVTDDAFVLVEDPLPDAGDLPGPRFGMHLDARGPLLGVGANRKDWLGVHDAGLGFVFAGPHFATASLHARDAPQASDYMAFRVAIADVVGDSAHDVTFALLKRRELLVWDGRDLLGVPRVVEGLPGSGDHFANGLSAGQLMPGARETLLVGDPTYDRPDAGLADDTGRVVLIW